MVGSSVGGGEGLGSSASGASSGMGNLVTQDPEVIASYSLRKNVNSYAGPCLRIRRSSDNQELDIGFDSFGDLDVSTISSFVGPDQAFVKTLYDQKDGYNLIQTTNGLQPELIFDRGTYIEFVDGKYLRASSFIGTQTSSSVSITWQSPKNPAQINSQIGGIDFSSTEFISPWWTVEQSLSYYNGGTLKSANIYCDDSTWRHHLISFKSGSMKMFDNSARAFDTSAATAPSYSRLTVGKNDFGDASMKLFDLTFYNDEVEAKPIFELMRTYNLFNVVDELVIVLGDSISTSGFTGLSLQWPYVALNYLGEWTTYAQGGYSLNDFDLSVVEYILSSKSHIRSTVLIFAGTNDIYVDSQSAANTFNRLKTLAQGLRALGVDLIIPMTALPRFESITQASIDFEVIRQDFSDMIVDDTSGDFDVVIDIRNIPDIADFGAQDSEEYVDYVHLSDSGANFLGTYVTDDLVNILV